MNERRCIHLSVGPILESLEARLLLDGTTAQQAIELFHTTPAVFIENQGQWADSTVRYVHNGQGANIAHTDSGPVFELFREVPGDADDAEAPSAILDLDFEAEPAELERLRFSATFDGANAVTPVGLNEAETHFNFLVGDPSGWREDVPSYEIVAYEGLYDGIDLHTWGRRDHLKYEFHVASGADFSQIRVSYSGIDGLSIDEAGALHVRLPGDWGEVVDDAPYIYQLVGGEQVEVAGAYRLVDADTYAFEITGRYDPTRQLIVDPDLAWATYLGRSEYEQGKGIAVDSAGCAYVTGLTYSHDWATHGAHDTTHNGWYDVFVAKLDSTGSSLLYATYLGGSSSETGAAIAVDGAGCAYVTGETWSIGWATSGAYDTTYSGGPGDAFVAKLSATGSSLLYATYLGGGDGDSGAGIAVDGAGCAYVAGGTYSPGWATAGAYDTTHNGESDVFVAKVSATGSSLLYATYLGGTRGDDAAGITVDAPGCVYVTGNTWSTGWASSEAYDTTLDGRTDGFVAKLSVTGSSLVYATYLGGNDSDSGTSVVVDGAGCAYVTGQTQSPGWGTSEAYDTTLDGRTDGFVAKLSVTGSSLVYATYLGGSDYDAGFGIGVDGAGCAYVTGRTTSPDWATPGAYDATYNGGFDAFVATVSPTGSSLLYATYLGGSGTDEGWGIAVDGPGGPYVTGASYSPGLATDGAYDTTHNGSCDAFVAKILTPTPGAWQSAAEHAQGIGEVLLVIADDGSFSEPRMTGVSKLRIDFPEAIDPASFTPAGVLMACKDAGGQELDLSGIVVTTSTTGGDTVGIIEFTPGLPDVGRYLVQVEGITDVAGNALAGDNDRVFTAIAGDALGDLRVNAIDLSYLWANRVFAIDGVTESQTRSDVNCDGRVNAIDLSAAWARRGANMQNVPDPVLPGKPGGARAAGDAVAEAVAAAVWAQADRVDALEGGEPNPGRAGPGRGGSSGPRASSRYRRRAELRRGLRPSRTPSAGVSTVPAGTDAVEVAGDRPAAADADLLDVLALSRLLPRAL